MFIYKNKKSTRISLCLLFVGFLSLGTLNSSSTIENTVDVKTKKIGSIELDGNKIVSSTMIRRALPFHEGSPFTEDKATAAIKILDATEYFENINILEAPSPKEADAVDLLIKVKEKYLLAGYEITGNQKISTKKLAENSGLKNLKAVSLHDIKNVKNGFLKEYRKANYLAADVDIVASISNDDSNRIFLHLDCKEGAKLKLKKVHLAGCNSILKSVLAEKLFTKEDWAFAGISGIAGVYSPEFLEFDKSIIQKYYMDQGYYNAKVTDVKVDQNAETNELTVTFNIHEGKQHKVRFIDVSKDDTFSEDELKSVVLLNRNEPFSAEKMVKSMERIKSLFGSRGYVFANVYPDIKPVMVDGQEFVDVEFKIEKDKIFNINNIRISGNKTTRDYVIRRELSIVDGSPANKVAMDQSLERVEALGYFDRNLDWKITKVSDDAIDLDLNLTEIRTGSGHLGASIGTDRGASSHSIKFDGEIRKRNFAGLGWDIGAGLMFGANKLHKLSLDFRNPMIFNTNLFFGTSFAVNRVEYVELSKSFGGQSPIETSAALSSRIGCYLLPQTARLALALDFGFETLDFEQVTQKKLLTSAEKLENDALLASKAADITKNPQLANYFKAMANDRLKNGSMNWFGASLSKDCLNHPLYPTRGWRCDLSSKFILPFLNYNFSMFKSELTARYYTPVIGRDRLVFSSTARLGFTTNLGNNKPIPFKELYLAGGPETLRGFRWGEAGPTYRKLKTPLGGKKQFLASMELITPMVFGESGMDTPRAYMFYDVGAAWDTPIAYDVENGVKKRLIPERDILKNDLNLRHTVGFGLKMTTPQPIRVEWGYKLDRHRRSKERPSEWHLSMNMPFDM